MPCNVTVWQTSFIFEQIVRKFLIIICNFRSAHFSKEHISDAIVEHKLARDKYFLAGNISYVNMNLSVELCEDRSIISQLWLWMEVTEQLHASTGFPL
jgi:hypothetical protein